GGDQRLEVVGAGGGVDDVFLLCGEGRGRQRDGGREAEQDAHRKPPRNEVRSTRKVRGRLPGTSRKPTPLTSRIVGRRRVSSRDFGKILRQENARMGHRSGPNVGGTGPELPEPPSRPSSGYHPPVEGRGEFPGAATARHEIKPGKLNRRDPSPR